MFEAMRGYGERRKEDKMKALSLPAVRSGPYLLSVVVPDHLDSNPSSATNSVISSKLSDLSVLLFPHL